MEVASNPGELPPYRALLVVDMKDFSGEKGRDHAQLTEEIPRILRDAFRRGGVADVWDERRFHGTTGDGYFVGFGSTYLPYLLNPVLVALQDELEYRNRVAQVTAHPRPIRMRASVHVGPMTDSGTNALGDGSGVARVETHRLLDSDPVRDLLKRSANTTCVAAVVSARAFEDAVLPGYAAESPDLYVPAPVQVKTFRATAYLRVPHPSGELLTKGFRPDDGDGSAQRNDDDGPGGPGTRAGDTVWNTMRNVRSKGDVVQGRDVHNDRRRFGVGSIPGPVGSVVTDPRGPVHTGRGDQINAPSPRRRRAAPDDH